MPEQENRKDWEYIVVPEVDEIREEPYPTLRINEREFGPGKHLVDPVTAEWLRYRMRLYAQSQIRIMNPKAHKKSLETLNQQNRNNAINDAGENAPSVR